MPRSLSTLLKTTHSIESPLLVSLRCVVVILFRLKKIICCVFLSSRCASATSGFCFCLSDSESFTRSLPTRIIYMFIMSIVGVVVVVMVVVVVEQLDYDIFLRNISRKW